MRRDPRETVVPGQTGRRAAALAIDVLLVFALAGTSAAAPARVTSLHGAARTPSALVARSPRGGQPSVAEVESLFAAGSVVESEAAARALIREEERVHGPASAETGWALHLLGVSMHGEGKVTDPETRDVSERALRITEAALGPDSLSTLYCMKSLALLYYDRYETAQAIELMNRMLDIQLRAAGPPTELLAITYRNLASAEERAGNDSAAVRHAERAVQILRPGPPEDVPLLAQSLNVLATVLYTRGDVVASVPPFEEALALFTRAGGPDDPSVAQCLHNLGAVYCELGDFDAARRSFQKALDLRRRTLPRGHPLIGSTWRSLAYALEHQGDLRGARACLVKGLRIQERALGAGHGDIGWTLAQLGRLDVAEGRYGSARERLERALGIQERTQGREAPELSWTLGALAAVQEARHDRPAARRSFERALAILERAYGPDHPDRIRLLNDYSAFLGRAGDSTLALDVALRSAEARSALIRYGVRGLSERQSLFYLSVGPEGLDLATALAGRGVGGPEGASRAWDAVIRSRTLVLDEMASRQRISMTAAADSVVQTAVAAMNAARRRYATLLVRDPGGGSAGGPVAALDRAREDMERAERVFGAQSQAYRIEEARAQIGLGEVIAAIPPGTALVAYSLGGQGESQTYAAMIATSAARPSIVSLGSARVIDARIERWLEEIARAPAGDRGEAAMRAERACRSAGRDVRRSVWDPIARLLGSVPRVYLVPDGSLCRINFEALPLGADQYLADSGPLLHLLGSERDLVHSEQEVPVGTGLLALGGPSFDQPGIEPSAAGSGSPGDARNQRRSADGANGLPLQCPDFRKIRFSPLAGSAHEAQEVARVWPDSSPAIVLTGARASQAAFEALAPGKRVVHLATHGFFLDGAHCASGDVRRGIGGISATGGAGRPGRPGQAAAIVPDSPLRLSGVALAGANRRNEAASGEDDGIMTAEEVAALDLAGIEWAVLSACDTGVGRVQAGEGVLGLRRAFQIAGARTVIMSLWGVEDQATLRWMTALYEGRFKRGLGTAEAVREADRSVLRERRAQGRSTHPFYWAGFVASGDWR